MNKNLKRLFFAMAFKSALSAFSYVDSYALGESGSSDVGGDTGEKSTGILIQN